MGAVALKDRKGRIDGVREFQMKENREQLRLKQRPIDFDVVDKPIRPGVILLRVSDTSAAQLSFDCGLGRGGIVSFLQALNGKPA